jgi:hypothetical protein
MAFREVSVVEIREVLRLWLRGTALRRVTGLTGVDRKTVRRYVQAAVAGGLLHDGGEEQLTDELIGHVCERVRPARPYGHGAAWSLIAAEHGLIKGWLDDDGLTVVKVHALLSRRGIEVPYRTLHRYAVSELGFGKRQPTLRVADGEPGQELQVDFGRMGLLRDGERRRVCHALIFTAAYSRHCFAWLTFRQTTEAVIAGFEAAWQFFGGYVGDRRQDMGADPARCGGSPATIPAHEALTSSRCSSPSKMRWRPTWPFAMASSRCRSRVGRNSSVVTKKEQDSQIDSKWQSSSTGRAQ